MSVLHKLPTESVQISKQVKLCSVHFLIETEPLVRPYICFSLLRKHKKRMYVHTAHADLFAVGTNSAKGATALLTLGATSIPSSIFNGDKKYRSLKRMREF